MNPEPFFNNITIEINEWNLYKNNSLLSKLALIFNRLLIQKIMCIWVDSIFIHKCRLVEIDIIF